MKKQIIVAVSGGFDPIHIGHVRMFREAKKLGDKVIVILNNDNWLKKKKGYVFMSQQERKEVIEALECVDEVIFTKHPKNPKDMTVCRELLELKPDIFANGGDRKGINIATPEVAVCKNINCKDVYNVGHGGKIQSSSWLLAKYANKIESVKKINIQKVLNELKIMFGKSKIKFPEELRLKTSKIILQLMNRKKGFGLFIILGWKSKWDKYIDMPDAKQDIYKKHHQNLLKHYQSHKHDIETTINFDGAILVDKNGNILHSGVMIEGLRPKEIANKVNPGKFKDLSEQFGFNQKVHLRHLSAISASYIFKGTTAYTVSEETDSFHIFEFGKIVYSRR